MLKQTVFPSVPGGFPPATFFAMEDALKYARHMQDLPGKFGICFCPPTSYSMHTTRTPSPDTSRGL
nr:hypothetical protein [Pseudomonas syringae pv. actinidiae]